MKFSNLNIQINNSRFPPPHSKAASTDVTKTEAKPSAQESEETSSDKLQLSPEGLRKSQQTESANAPGDSELVEQLKERIKELKQEIIQVQRELAATEQSEEGKRKLLESELASLQTELTSNLNTLLLLLENGKSA